MNILEIAHVRERAGIRAAIEGGAGFRGHDRAVVVDFLNDGDVAVIRVGTFLACGEHDDIADMARRVINPLAQGAGRIGPLATVAHVGACRQTELMAAHIHPPRALAELVGVADVSGGMVRIEVSR